MTSVPRCTPSSTPEPAGCQVVDRVHDAKDLISRELDVIRDRLGRPVPREAIDRADPSQRLDYAEGYVDGKLTAGHCAGVDRGMYVGLVDQHLTPAPDDRLWLTRQRNARLVPLRPVDPDEAARLAARQRAAAARAAWEHLHDVGYAGDGADGDLITEVLAPDLPGPRPVILITRTIDPAGDVMERVTQAELWDVDDYPGGDAA